MATMTKSAATILNNGAGKALSLAAETEKTVTSITRSGVTATVTITSHGFSNGDVVYIYGSAVPEYNGVWTISNVATNTFDYTLEADPGASASGTIKCWRGKLGTALDLSSAFGADIFGYIHNGATGPGAGLKVLLGLSRDGTEPKYEWREILQAGAGNLEKTPINYGLPYPVMHANLFFYGNTSQAVLVEAYASKVTAVS